jgi:hypothetical protein
MHVPNSLACLHELTVTLPLPMVIRHVILHHVEKYRSSLQMNGHSPTDKYRLRHLYEQGNPLFFICIN